MIFATKISRFERKSDHKKKIDDFYSCAGEPVGITYEYNFIDGIKTLVPSGEVDRQSIIDSYAVSQDINVMINKFLQGDSSVLNPSSGQYGDFTNCPSTYAELFDHVQKCKNVFDSMPAEIKEKFDNSYEVFWSQFGSERFDAIFKDFNNDIDSNIGSPDVEIPVVPPKESEVK